MGFVFEKVPEEDWEFFNSMELKNCWGENLSRADEYTEWCADRERNAYLVGIGGGYHDMPYFYDLWWNGHIIRMEIDEGGAGNYDIGVDIIWFVNRIYVPQEIWGQKGEMLKGIEEAFAVNHSWCKKEALKTITVQIQCEPELKGE